VYRANRPHGMRSVPEMTGTSEWATARNRDATSARPVPPRSTASARSQFASPILRPPQLARIRPPNVRPSRYPPFCPITLAPAAMAASVRYSPVPVTVVAAASRTTSPGVTSPTSTVVSSTSSTPTTA
jgi:hypothetical protein